MQHTFYEYLIGQVRRQDYIGELARTAIDDSEAPKEGDFKEWQVYLISRGACKEILEALGLVWVEYTEEMIGNVIEPCN